VSRTPRILVVGFGNMGRALAQGWLRLGRSSRDIFVRDPDPMAQKLAVSMGLSLADDGLARQTFDIVLLAVKPQQLERAADGLQAFLGGSSVMLSIVAGKRVADIAASIGARGSIVRAMPNTPAAIGRGMTVLVGSAGVTADQKALCDSLMRAAGETQWIEDEGLMDAVTAVSGSGPAYVFLLIECLARAGVESGLSVELATELATATVAGAGAYAKESGEAAAVLRKNVTSPGGTTEAALEVLMRDNALARLLIDAVNAATERSRALSANVEEGD
jgi:pyrroline-5-carboxylate reductase